MQNVSTAALDQPRHIVLLVDDDPGDRRLFRYMFAEHVKDAKLLDIPGGVELLEWLANNKTLISKTVILLDLNMPDMADAALQVIPVLIYSTSDSERDIVEAYSKGANAYIKKPSSLSELGDYIESIKGFWFNVVKTAPSEQPLH